MEGDNRIFESMEATECTVTQELTGRSRNRRSSILKPQKPRNPLQDLDFNPTLADETTVTRKSRRVSFAAGMQVKEFHEVRTEVSNITVWGQSYEQTILNSGSDSSHHVDLTAQADSIDISNIDALVTGRIHVAGHRQREDSENIPAEVRSNRGSTQVRFGTERQENHNATSNGTAAQDRPLDLTLGTAKPPSNKSLQAGKQNGSENGSIFHSEFSYRSMKTTFYGGDDEMDLSLSMQDESNNGLFDKTGYVDMQDLSSSNEVFGANCEEENGQARSFGQSRHVNETVYGGSADFTELLTKEIFLRPSSGRHLQATETAKQFNTQGAYENEKTVFASNMDFTEPVDVHMLFPLRSNYHAEADETSFVENMDLTEPINQHTSSYGDDDVDMDVGGRKAEMFVHQSQEQQVDKRSFFENLGMAEPVCFNLSESHGSNLRMRAMGIPRSGKTAEMLKQEQIDQLNKTKFVDEMDITKPLNVAIMQHQQNQLNKTAFVDEMEMTKPVNVAITQHQQNQLNKTAFVDEMEITKPVNVAITQHKQNQLNRTAFVDEMDITKPVNVAIMQHQQNQLNKTAFVDEMEMTKPVNVAITQHQQNQLNKTAFVDEMEMTKPVNVAITQHKQNQLNRTAFVDEMDITKPVNVAIIQHQQNQLNKTAFVDEMEMTKPVNVAITQHQQNQSNRTAFVDEMDITKPVNVAIMQQQQNQLNKTAFVDEMDITKPVNVAIMQHQQNQLNKTAFVDEMELTKPVNVAITQHKQNQLNKTAFVDEMDITKPVSVAIMQHQQSQLNQTAFVDEMDITKPVNVEITQNQQNQLNKTTFFDEMDITKPVNVVIMQHQQNQLNKTAFVDEMEITKPVSVSITQHQQNQLNQTAFVDEMEITKPVSVARMQHQQNQLNQTAFVDEMEITKPVNVAIIQHQQNQLNQTAFVDEMEITKPVMHQPTVISTATKNEGETMTFNPTVRFGQITETTKICEELNEETRLQEYENICNYSDVSIHVGGISPLTNSLSDDMIEPTSPPSYINSGVISEISWTESPRSPRTFAAQSAATEKCSDESKVSGTWFGKTSSEEIMDSVQNAEITTSSASRSSSTSTNLKALSQTLQDTLNKLKVVPIPEISSNFTSEKLSPKRSSEKFNGHELRDCAASNSVEHLGLAEEIEYRSGDNEAVLSGLKRPVQLEASITESDLCSPPKQTCLRGNSEELLPAQKCGTIGVLFPASSVSLLNPEETEDSFIDNEELIISSEQQYVEEIIVSSRCQEDTNGHLDSNSDEEQKLESDEMVALIPVIEQGPETIEETIRKLEKSSKEWVILRLGKSAWSFSFFCQSMDLVLRLGAPCGAGDQEVIAIHFISHRTEKSRDLCHFSHKWMMNAFPVEEMESVCKNVSDAANLLTSISHESAKIKLFVDNFVSLETSYGFEMKDDQQSAEVIITSYPLFSSFVLTVNMQDSWESFEPDEIKVYHLVGKTVKTDVIKSLARGVEAGPNCLKNLFLDVLKYVNNLEMVRPPGPLRFD